MWDPSSYLPVVIIKYYAIIIWSLYSTNVLIGVFGVIYRSKSSKTKSDKVEIVIVSIASVYVKKSLFECIAQTRQRFLNTPISVLVDEGSDLLDELMQARKSFQGISQIAVGSLEKKGHFVSGGNPSEGNAFNLVVVPDDYRRDLVGKGRALSYFTSSTSLQEDKWYAFIDDDNIILDDSFLYEIPYYEERGYSACNPILVPRAGKNKTCFIMDWIRYFDDNTVFRLFTGLLKTPLVGLHGEMLCAKGSVLRSIGYNRHTIVEDFRFASEMVKRGLKTWHSSTRVSIKSPNSVYDLCRQRGRWFRGIWNDYKYCPPIMKLIVGIRLIGWTNGFIGSWALSPLWAFWPVDLPIFAFISIGGINIWMIYIYAIIKTKQPIYKMFLIPVFGLYESSAIWIAKNKHNGFVVIDKN
jgi:egghead protein (zeste-white 4 protein)